MNGVVLISGNGSNLQSIIDNAQSIDLTICCVISNKTDAFGLKRAAKVSIPYVALDETLFDSKLDFDQEIMKVIDNYQPGVIILAGYMRILSADFISKYFLKISSFTQPFFQLFHHQINENVNGELLVLHFHQH